MRFIDSAEGTRPVRATGRAGLHIPGYASVGGKALLAALEDDALRGVMKPGFKRITDAINVNKVSTREEIKEIL